MTAVSIKFFTYFVVTFFNENTVYSCYFIRTSEEIFQLHCSSLVMSGNAVEGLNMQQAITFTSSNKYFYCKGVMTNICDISSELPSDKVYGPSRENLSHQ